MTDMAHGVAGGTRAVQGAPDVASIPYVVCDVFTDRPLAGNQLGVFVDATGLGEAMMQGLARELNYSESTFVLPPDGAADARIRIFTPGRELPFAGHPTLGTALVLAQRLGLDEIRLETGSGVVPIRFEKRGPAPFGWMEQPIPTIEPFADQDELLLALHLEGSELPIEAYDNGIRHVFVALPSEDQVAALRPDFGALAGFGPIGVNCFAGSGDQWKTRMFAPGLGVAEDPATGSAAGPLAVHLSQHNRIAWGTEIEIRQGAEIGRPSKLYARAVGSSEGIERVEVGGSAVVVANGAFSLLADPGSGELPA